MPRRAGMRPRISQEYRGSGRVHHGVDVMYRPDGGAWAVPEGTPALAAGPGRVVRVDTTARGVGVVVQHAPTVAPSRSLWTYYQHLTEAHVSVGEAVRAGQVVGIVGADPTDPQGLRHLHFEVWSGGWTDSIDPAPLMSGWGVVDA